MGFLGDFFQVVEPLGNFLLQNFGNFGSLGFFHLKKFKRQNSEEFPTQSWNFPPDVLVELSVFFF